MNCPNVQKLIPLYLDNQLKDNELQVVKSHINGCSHCQKEIELYQKSWDALKNLKEIDPAPGYISRFWSRVATDKSFSQKLAEGIRGVLTSWQWAGTLVTASIVVIVGFFSLKNFLPGTNVESALAKMHPEELELVSNLELAQNLDVIENIDVLEDLEVIENLDLLESKEI